MRSRLFSSKKTLSRPIKRGFAAFVSLVLLGAIYLLAVSMMRVDPGEESYVVQPGTSLRAFSRQLYQQGVLVDPYSLVALAYLQGRSRGLKAGEYRFAKGITPLALLDQVIAGRVVEYPLVILEGWTFKQMMQAIEAAPKLVHTLKGVAPAEVMKVLGYRGVHPEGRFFPDTYYYTAGTPDIVILRQAYRKMEAYLAKEWAQRESGLPLKTPEEALTLASIVEKETGRAEERARVAGVFVNRLRKGMRLQTDPTVIYGMGDAFKGNLRLKDLRKPTPYNTYTQGGLPPTPIAMPGAAAIHAALHPAKTRALYFVSRGDGSHVFSETLKEHNAAVLEHQVKRALRPVKKASP